jgi:hypothetical protein
MEWTLSAPLPELWAEATERRALLARLEQDQGLLSAQARAHTALIGKLGDDLRSTQDERRRLLFMAGLLASAVATLLSAAALKSLLRQKAARKQTPGSWYRPGAPALPAPVYNTSAEGKAPRTAEAALSPITWTDEEGAATMPLVKEYGRLRTPPPTVSG